jgi:hypothetical protein
MAFVWFDMIKASSHTSLQPLILLLFHLDLGPIIVAWWALCYGAAYLTVQLRSFT